ncbi:MAG: hypothetical protein M3374_01045 [Pseudomonadota bacterium]|nr:hypothetical protein [Pseudomonadota bacterium]
MAAVAYRLDVEATPVRLGCSIFALQMSFSMSRFLQSDRIRSNNPGQPVEITLVPAR